MGKPRSPLGFGTTKQTADFFDLSTSEVLHSAQTGEWRSWLVEGRRLFDLDEIVRQLAQQSRAAADCMETDTDKHQSPATQQDDLHEPFWRQPCSDNRPEVRR